MYLFGCTQYMGIKEWRWQSSKPSWLFIVTVIYYQISKWVTFSYMEWKQHNKCVSFLVTMVLYSCIDDKSIGNEGKFIWNRKCNILENNFILISYILESNFAEMILRYFVKSCFVFISDKNWLVVGCSITVLSKIL